MIQRSSSDFRVRVSSLVKKRTLNSPGTNFCESSLHIFYYINVLNMMRIPNLSGTFDYGPNVRGTYKKHKNYKLDRKKLWKTVYFSIERYGLLLNNTDGTLSPYQHKLLNHDKNL